MRLHCLNKRFLNFKRISENYDQISLCGSIEMDKDIYLNPIIFIKMNFKSRNDNSYSLKIMKIK